MQLPFNEVKTTQAAGRFLQLAGGKLNYMVLIKLLYMLDRASIVKWHRPVTFGEYYSMKNGPVISEVRDLITEMVPPVEQGYWSQYISEPAADRSVALRSGTDTDALSEAEEELIQTVFRAYEQYLSKPFELVDLLHKILPEWKEVTSGRVPLPLRDILAAENKSQEEIEATEQELESLATDLRVLLTR
jgi:hypothetical protein